MKEDNVVKPNISTVANDNLSLNTGDRQLTKQTLTFDQMGTVVDEYSVNKLMVINKMKSDEIMSLNKILLLSQDTNPRGKNSDKGFFKRTRKVLFPGNLDTRYTVSNKIENLKRGVDSLACLPINMNDKLKISPKINRMNKNSVSPRKKKPQLKRDKFYRKQLKDPSEREILGKLPNVQSLQSRKFNIKKISKKGNKFVEKVSQILNVRNEKEKGNQNIVLTKINCGTPLIKNPDSDSATDSLAIIPKNKISRYYEIANKKGGKKSDSDRASPNQKLF